MNAGVGALCREREMTEANCGDVDGWVVDGWVVDGWVVVVWGLEVVVVVGNNVVGAEVATGRPSHRYDTPHCPSPLKHCPGRRSVESHGVHMPHPLESSKLSLVRQSLDFLQAKHKPLSG